MCSYDSKTVREIGVAADSECDNGAISDAKISFSLFQLPWCTLIEFSKLIQA
jgi:hypothetical protein